MSEFEIPKGIVRPAGWCWGRVDCADKLPTEAVNTGLSLQCWRNEAEERQLKVIEDLKDEVKNAQRELAEAQQHLREIKANAASTWGGAICCIHDSGRYIIHQWPENYNPSLTEVAEVAGGALRR